MSNPAIAHGRVKLVDIGVARLNPPRKKRKSVANTAQLPWSGVALRSDIAASSGLGRIQRPPTYVWLLVAAAALFHAGLGWYINSHPSDNLAKPKPTEVALQFERPKPPEPKIEPPKPEPKREQPKQAQVLPPIQTAAPEPSNEPAAPSAEPPVAVAPIVTAPPEPPPAQPISAAVSKAEYLNNPRGVYPAQASRQGWQGTVVVLVHISAEGKVLSVEVKKSSGYKVLDNDAMNVIKTSWSFTPRKRGDTPVAADVTVPYEYVLE